MIDFDIEEELMAISQHKSNLVNIDDEMKENVCLKKIHKGEKKKVTFDVELEKI